MTIEQEAQALISALQSFGKRAGDEGFVALAMVCMELSNLIQEWLDKRPATETTEQAAESLQKFVPPVRFGQPRVIRIARDTLRGKHGHE